MTQTNVEPYSSVLRLPNNFILFSGIKAWGLRKENEIYGDIEMQTLDIFKQLDELLAKENLNKAAIVKVQCFLVNISDYNVFNNKYVEWIGNARPCRAVIGCSQLRLNAKIELIIDCYNF